MLLYYDNTFKVFFVNANAFIKRAKINKSRIYYIYIFIMSKYNNTTKETTEFIKMSTIILFFIVYIGILKALHN